VQTARGLHPGCKKTGPQLTTGAAGKLEEDNLFRIRKFFLESAQWNVQKHTRNWIVIRAATNYQKDATAVGLTTTLCRGWLCEANQPRRRFSNSLRAAAHAMV